MGVSVGGDSPQLPPTLCTLLRSLHAPVCDVHAASKPPCPRSRSVRCDPRPRLRYACCVAHLHAYPWPDEIRAPTTRAALIRPVVSVRMDLDRSLKTSDLQPVKASIVVKRPPSGFYLARASDFVAAVAPVTGLRRARQRDSRNGCHCQSALPSERPLIELADVRGWMINVCINCEVVSCCVE